MSRPVKMPQMPQNIPSLPGEQDNAAVVSPAALSTQLDPEEEENLEPSLPKLESVESTLSNSIKIPNVLKKGIRVIALRQGFFNQQRIVEGEEFIVKSGSTAETYFENFGNWMKCVDPDLEKKKLEFYKNKKAKK